MATNDSFDTGDIVYESELKAIHEAHKFQGVLSGLAVTEKGAGADMSVDVSDGYCVSNGILETLSGGPTNLAISNGDASNPRIDTIIYDVSANTAAVVEGNPAATPNPQDRSDANDVILARVHVEANETTSIQDSDIYDCRTLLPGSQAVHTASDWKFNNSADIYLYSDYGSTQKIKLDGGDGSADFEGNVTVGGDLTVEGNDIKNSTPATVITFSGTETQLAGDLKVGGNDIKDSAGNTSITFNGSGTLTTLTTTGNGQIKCAVGTDLIFAPDSEAAGVSCGTTESNQHWNAVCANGLYYDVTSPTQFDEEDDLGLIESIIPMKNENGEYVRDELGGLKTDPTSVPDIILHKDENGNVIYTTDDLNSSLRHAFVDVGKAQSLAFGGIKQLYQMTKDEFEKLYNCLEVLNNRLKLIEEST